MKKVAIIISTYNEENNINKMYKEVIDSIDTNNYLFNICFVDDGSVDNSYNKIKELMDKDDKVKVLKFKRNFGHEMAMIAGVDNFIDYDYYILLDCDLQHPPKYIMSIVKALDDNHDIVLMRRERNDSRSAITSFFSELYYDLFNLIFRENFEKNASDFMAFNNDIANIVRSKYRYKNRLLRYIIQRVSNNRIIIDYTPEKRFSGESKYSFIKYSKLALQSIKSVMLLNNESKLNDLYYEIEK